MGPRLALQARAQRREMSGALVLALNPGACTVVTSSAIAGATGVVLVEFYVVP